MKCPLCNVVGEMLLLNCHLSFCVYLRPNYVLFARVSLAVNTWSEDKALVRIKRLDLHQRHVRKEYNRNRTIVSPLSAHQNPMMPNETKAFFSE